jgi:hypothetical protein
MMSHPVSIDGGESRAFDGLVDIAVAALNRCRITEAFAPFSRDQALTTFHPNKPRKSSKQDLHIHRNPSGVW